MAVAKTEASVAQTHLWYQGKCFYISTIQRIGEATEGSGSQLTVVWEWNIEKKGVGVELARYTSLTGDLQSHLEAINDFYNFGQQVIDDGE